jgi:rod shape-determining protein MreC
MLKRRRNYIAFLFVFGLAVLVLNLPGSTAAKLKLAISSLFVPLFGLAGSFQKGAETSAGMLMSRPDLLRQNSQLQREIEKLRFDLMQQEELIRENALLRSQLGWQKQISWNPKLARVVARDPENWWRSVIIDLGIRDGISTNMPVITTAGLIGRTSIVGENRSHVVLLGDRNLRVGAMIRETGETGVIVPASAGPLENNMVEMVYLPGNSGTKRGHNVITSGDGGLFRRGIVIGSVVDTRSIGYGLATEARIKLAADFSSLEHVWVLP